MTDFAPLMKSAYLAHREFHSVWDKTYPDKTKVEPKEVTLARNRFFEESDRLFHELSKYVDPFFAGDPGAIDAILNFLETDVPAFRCGYAKEKFYRRLKSMSLSAIQIARIGNLALALCQTDSYRREFRDLVRLMVKLADSDFIARIRSIENASGVIGFKARLMLETIRHNRSDLT